MSATTSAWDPKKPSDPELQKLLDDIAVLWESADEKSRRQITTRLKTLAYEASLMHWSVPSKRGLTPQT